MELKKAARLIYHAADESVGRAFRTIFSALSPVDKKKIMFMTHSDAYECNPKYVAEEIIRQRLDYRLVWVVPKRGRIDRRSFPKELKLVRRNSFAFLKEISSAGVWIDNSINFLWQSGIVKKKKQTYFEIWHGSLGIKRLGRDDVSDKRWVRLAGRCNKVTDYCVSNSGFENEVYRGSFWQKPPILLYGHPRNDCLFDEEKRKKARSLIEKKYGIAKAEKLLLYAPTFRENGKLSVYELDFSELLSTLSERFGGRWRLILRMHFQDRSRNIDMSSLPEGSVNVTGHTDIQELLLCADAGITDYSSWAYDYMLRRKPLFIYAPDVNEYEKMRGLYYPLSSTPFPVAETHREMVENIKKFDEEAYELGVSEFLKEKECAEDGHAAERVVEKIKELTKE